MKVILNTIDGEEVIFTERHCEEKGGKDTSFVFGKTYAVIQAGQSTLEFKADELFRAVNAMWGKDKENEPGLWL